MIIQQCSLHSGSSDYKKICWSAFKIQRLWIEYFLYVKYLLGTTWARILLEGKVESNFVDNHDI